MFAFLFLRFWRSLYLPRFVCRVKTLSNIVPVQPNPPRCHFVQHHSAGIGGVYSEQSFAAVECLASCLRDDYDDVVMLVFHAALRELLKVSLQRIDVRILTCRQAKGCECQAAILCPAKNHR